MNAAIEIRQLRKSFGTKQAVRDLDLVVPSGSLYGFIGPNGAGKSTTIRMIMSIIFPDSGDLRVLGRASAVESKDRIGYLPEERGVYRKMKVGAFLNYMGQLKGVDTAECDKRVKQWLDRMSLADNYRKKCEELSKGMQQKVQFIAAVLHEPELLILDEPFSGLDPVNSRLLRELIDEQHDAGRTVIFSTHQMFQAEQICDRIVMIHQGIKRLDATPAEIAAKYAHRTLLLDPIDRDSALARLPSIPGVRRVDDAGAVLEVELDPAVDPSAGLAAIAAAVPVRRIEVRRTSLEDVFIEIVEGSELSHEARERAREQLRTPAALGTGRDSSGD